jgi:MYXO-CTERM domain-containing protein
MILDNLRIAALSVAILAGTSGAAFAQAEAPATAETPAAAAETATDDDEGFDLGWLGLIGLAGLAGLARRREPVVHRTTTTAGTPRV